MAAKYDRPNGAGDGPKRSRRGLLAGAAGALGVLAAETVATALTRTPIWPGTLVRL